MTSEGIRTIEKALNRLAPETLAKVCVCRNDAGECFLDGYMRLSQPGMSLHERVALEQLAKTANLPCIQGHALLPQGKRSKIETMRKESLIGGEVAWPTNDNRF
jgi:hypothetical protein